MEAPSVTLGCLTFHRLSPISFAVPSAGPPLSLPSAGTPLDAELKRRRTEKAHRLWREHIASRNHGKRIFRISAEGVKPRIRERLRAAPKSLAARFYQPASGHAMTAPFLTERFGWVESDVCWRCGIGRQTREHLFKECLAWREEIRTLWKKVGRVGQTGGRAGGTGEGRVCKGERALVAGSAAGPVRATLL